MTLLSLISYAFLQVVIPVLIGSLFGKVYNGPGRVLFFWIGGQMVLWAGFQLITVPFVLTDNRLRNVLWCMAAFVLVLLLLRLILFVRGREWKVFSVTGGEIGLVQTEAGSRKLRIRILQILSVLLLVLQLGMTLCYAYEEGDDAFYLALSTDTWDSGIMYGKNPYTGYLTGLDIRHGLAPFPMWISLLSRLSGILPITMAQLILPVVVVLMAYGIHYLVGRQLFGENRESRWLYFVVVELLVLFGGYSTYSVENFLLVRASQGKAVLCNLILPFLVFLCFLLLKGLQKGKELHWSYWILFFGVSLAGSLCSTQGGLLLCILMAILGLCILIIYKKWKYLILLGGSCLFPIGYMILYVAWG